MPELITSVTNPKVKQLVRLRDRKERDKTGLTIIDGPRELANALDVGVHVLEIYYSGPQAKENAKAIFARVKESETTIYETSKSVFEKIAYGEKKDGVLAVAKVAAQTLKEARIKKSGLYVVLEGIEKPGNVGAILRTCDGAGVDGIFICEGDTDIYNPNAIRASLGAVFTLSIISATSADTHKFLKENKVNLYATSPDAKKIYTDIKGKEAAALILGSEEAGLSPFWLKSCETVKIPMKGKIDSLNVSSAAAVILYEINRQRLS